MRDYKKDPLKNKEKIPDEDFKYYCEQFNYNPYKLAEYFLGSMDSKTVQDIQKRNARNYNLPLKRCKECPEWQDVLKEVEERRIAEYGSLKEYYRQRTERTKKTNQEIYGCDNVFQNKEIQEKSKKTIQEKYGVDNVSQCPEIQEQKKATNREKFGYDWCLQSPEVREQIKQTCMELYGVTCAGIRPEVLEKNMEKYGVPYPIMAKEVQEKARKTCLGLYGVEYLMQSPEFRKYQREKMIEIYGVDNYFKTEEFQERMIQKNREKFGVDYYVQSDEFKDKFKQSMLENWGVDHPMHSEEIRQKQINTIREIYGVDNVSQVPEIQKQKIETMKEHGYITTHINRSSYEVEIESWLHEVYTGEVLTNDRTIITPYELDFYFPEKKFAIEFNGDYWHSDALIRLTHDMSADEYHAMKTQRCLESGVELIFIWEHDWLQNKDEIQSNILTYLGVNNKGESS